MLNIETTTKLSPEETIKRAVKFFGPKGYGLEVVERVPLVLPPTEHNEQYLEAKKKKLGHWL